MSAQRPQGISCLAVLGAASLAIFGTWRLIHATGSAVIVASIAMILALASLIALVAILLRRPRRGTTAPRRGVLVKKKAKFLHRVMQELAGDAVISLEGSLERCSFDSDTPATTSRTLRRATILPRQDFILLRLTPKSVEPIFKQMLAAGFKRGILHVQIERAGVNELDAHDYADD